MPCLFVQSLTLLLTHVIGLDVMFAPIGAMLIVLWSSPILETLKTSSGALRISEKHFCCPACEHPSEMFGSVKAVSYTHLTLPTKRIV